MRWATFIILALLLIPSAAQALPISCEQVREYVAKYGKGVAIAYAIRNGATWRDIYEARKCLHERR